MKLPVREARIVVPGFRFAGVACGIKPSGRADLALIHSDSHATVAGVFTRNRVKAAPVVLAARHVRRGRARTVLINSGNANACTGQAGAQVALATCREAARVLGVAVEDVIPCSTGKIGVPLAVAPMRRGIRAASAVLDAHRLWDAARAMMTTDAFPKVASRRLRISGRTVTVAGLAKGAGMIAPDLATLLVCLVTDAAVPAPLLRRLLRAAVATSFNAITVDGDTSTNDTVLVLAGGRAGHAPLVAGSRDAARFEGTLGEVAAELADMVVADGEGATKRARITVLGARSATDARRVARAIAASQLVKTALYGGDPNWGRIVCAAGYAGVAFDPERVSIRIGPVTVLRRGEPGAPTAERRAAAVMRGAVVPIEVDLATRGAGTASVTTSDLSTAYVRFNSAYST